MTIAIGWCWPPGTPRSWPSCGASWQPKRRSAGPGLADVAAYPEPAETERTFEGNALLKARACVAATGLPALADDSGLAVDVLNQMPGVRSARWAGPGASDQENNALLLRQLADVPAAERTARFVCAMALVLPDGTEHVRIGDMRGRIGVSPAGTMASATIRCS